MKTVPGPIFDADALTSIDIPDDVREEAMMLLENGVRIHSMNWLQDHGDRCGGKIHLIVCAANTEIRSYPIVPDEYNPDTDCACGCDPVTVSDQSSTPAVEHDPAR